MIFFLKWNGVLFITPLGAELNFLQNDISFQQRAISVVLNKNILCLTFVF